MKKSIRTFRYVYLDEELNIIYQSNNSLAANQPAIRKAHEQDCKELQRFDNRERKMASMTELLERYRANRQANEDRKALQQCAA